MHSQKSLIISIIISLLILGGSVAFVKYKTATPTANTPNVQAEQVTIDDIMASCSGKDQCIIVDTKCSFCCDYVAINSKSEALYNQKFDKTCKNYSGTYCQCHDLSSYPSCINGQCQMVKWSENKPIKTPPSPQATAPAVPSPAIVSVPPQTPAVTSPPSSLDSFGETEDIPAATPQNDRVMDELYAPLPDKPPLPVEDDSVHVIQP